MYSTHLSVNAAQWLDKGASAVPALEPLGLGQDAYRMATYGAIADGDWLWPVTVQVANDAAFLADVLEDCVLGFNFVFIAVKAGSQGFPTLEVEDVSHLCGYVLLCEFAEYTALHLLLGRVVASPRREFIQEDALLAHLANRPTQQAFGVRPLGKYGGEVNANLVPVPHSALNAADAVVVLVSKSVHFWQADTSIRDDRQAILLRQPLLYENRPNVDIRVRIQEAVNTVLFFGCVAEDLAVAKLLVAFAHILFEESGAGSASRPHEESLLAEHLVDRRFVFFISQDDDFLPKPFLAVLQEAPVVLVLFLNLCVNDFQWPAKQDLLLLCDGQFRCNRAGGPTAKPAYGSFPSRSWHDDFPHYYPELEYYTSRPFTHVIPQSRYF